MNSETSDEYLHVLARSGRWRVVRCRDDFQFIIQKRRRGSGKWPWRAEADIYDAMKLPVVLQRRSMCIEPEHLDKILRELTVAA